MAGVAEPDPAAVDQRLAELRAGRPQPWPDQALYAEWAAAALGLRFADLDGGTGLLVEVSGRGRSALFGGGRCSYYPQNSAAAATLAHDKYLSARALDRAGVANLGGDYVFLHARHRALRSPGHERADAFAMLERLGGRAFAKPLNGSRGDFAQAILGAPELDAYLDAVAAYHDAVLLQPLVVGDQYRVFVLDGAVLYTARKSPPASRDEATLEAQGVSSAPLAHVPATPQRMNRSAGGAMAMRDPPDRDAVFDLACRAVAALGLRVGGVDLFTGLADAPHVRVIEVNANPAIRFLEDSGRADLILTIWRNTFASLGLLDV